MCLADRHIQLSDSLIRAENFQHQLFMSVNQLLKNDLALTHRLLSIDDTTTLFSTTSTRRPSFQTVRTMTTAEAPPPDTVEEEQPRASMESFHSLYTLHFEEQLHESGVYRRAKKSYRRFSLEMSVRNTRSSTRGSTATTSTVGNQGWSILSGLSLSDVSDISVLALPIYAGDIANPQHYYTFGRGPEQQQQHLDDSVLQTVHTPSAKTHQSDIRTQCFNIEQRLSRMSHYPFAALISDEKQPSKRKGLLPVLIGVFRRGLPLLAILDGFNLGDDSLHDGWAKNLPGALGNSGDDNNNNRETDDESIATVAVCQFISACVGILGVTQADCFAASDLFGTNRSRHAKVVRLVLQLLDMMTVEAPPTTTRTPTTHSRSPLFQRFFDGEHEYVAMLQDLVAVNDGAVIFGIVLGQPYLEQERWLSLFRWVREVVELQRRFLASLKVLHLLPYGYQREYLVSIFRDWELKLKVRLTRFVCPGQSPTEEEEEEDEEPVGPKRPVWFLKVQVGNHRIINTAYVLLVKASSRISQYMSFLEVRERISLNIQQCFPGIF